jgi:hypothetical protein
MTEKALAPPMRRHGGRPPLADERRVRSAHCALYPSQLEKLQRTAERRDVSFSRVVRDIISEWERRGEPLADAG